MVRLYEKLKTGGKARAACTGWILYWGIALGLLLFERELIVGTTEKDRKLYLPVFAGMIVLCFAAWGVSLARFARASGKRKKPVLLNAKLLLPVLLNAGYLFFEIEYIGNTEFFEMKWYYMLLNVGVIFLFCLFLTGIFNSLKRAMIFLNIFLLCHEPRVLLCIPFPGRSLSADRSVQHRDSGGSGRRLHL